MAYTPIGDVEIGPGQPLTTGLAFRFRDNPIGIAQRSAGAPWLNGIGGLDTFDTASVTSWTVPAGVFRAEFVLVGAGGGGDGADSVTGTPPDAAVAGGASSVDGIGTAAGGGVGIFFTANNGLRSSNQGRGARGEIDGVGGEVKIIVSNVTPGAVLSVTVGAGGAGGGEGLSGGLSGGDGAVYIRY